MEADGLEILDELDCAIFDIQKQSESVEGNAEGSRYAADALINGLQISSQLARHSEQHFRSLLKVFTAPKLGEILRCNNAVIRAKACNLIGNLCRHSDRFYTALARPLNTVKDNMTLLHLLATCCADSDASTRKFASFAGTFIIYEYVFAVKSAFLFCFSGQCSIPFFRSLSSVGSLSSRISSSPVRCGRKNAR